MSLKQEKGQGRKNHNKNLFQGRSTSMRIKLCFYDYWHLMLLFLCFKSLLFFIFIFTDGILTNMSFLSSHSTFWLTLSAHSHLVGGYSIISNLIMIDDWWLIRNELAHQNLRTKEEYSSPFCLIPGNAMTCGLLIVRRNFEAVSGWGMICEICRLQHQVRCSR